MFPNIPRLVLLPRNLATQWSWQVRVEAVEARPAGLLPSPSLVSSTISSQTEVTSSQGDKYATICRPVTQAKLYRKRVAYLCSTEDPDEDWTMLLLGKKEKPWVFSLFLSYSPACINIVVVSPWVGILLTGNRFIYLPCCADMKEKKIDPTTTSAALVEVHLSPPPNSVYGST